MTTFNTWRTVSVLWAGGAAMVAAVAILPAVAWAGTTWDGGGIDTNFTTGGNWNDDSAPTFTGGTSTLTFGTGGSTATVDTAADLARIILDRDASFTIADGASSLTLQGQDVGGVLTGITASPATADTTVAYTISESIALGATQAWNVANNGAGGTSLSVSGAISGAGVGLTKIGSGTLTLSGANTFTGVMAISGGAVEVGSWNLSGQNGVWGNRANDTAAPTTSFIQMNGGRINYTGASASGNLRGVNLASGTNTIDVVSGATLNFRGNGSSPGGFNTFQSNGGDLVKEGGGTLQLGSDGIANNIFTGKATINSGTLDWFGGGSMPAPAALVGDFITINDGATFAMSFTGGSTVNANIGFRLSGNATMLSGGGVHIITGPIADGGTPGSLQKTGTGTLTLSAANSFTGSTRIAAGTLNLSNASAILASTLDMNAADSGSVTFATNTTLGGLTGSRDLNLGTRVVSIGNNGQSTTYSGVISNGSLTKVGSGTLTLSGSNSYSGNTTISAGRLALGGNGVLGSGSYAGTIANDGELVVGSDAAQILSGVISGSGSVTKSGTGTLTLSAANTFTGVMAIDGGTVEVGSWNLSAQDGVWGNQANNNAAPTTSFIQMNGGRINYTGATRSGQLRGVNLASGTNTIDVVSGATLNFASSNTFQSNGGDLVKEGAGTLQLGTFEVANSVFTGKATINSGTLEWFGADSMPSPATLVSDFLTINNGAAFALSYSDLPTAVSANIGILLSGNATIRSGGSSGAFHSINGPIADGASAGSLQKTGPGTLGLSGANTFSGALTVAEGVLSINSWNNVSTNGPLGNSAANVVLGSATSAGTLRYDSVSQVDPPSTPRGIELAAGGGVIQLNGGDRDSGRVHISGSSISGSGPLTINNPNNARLLIVGSSTFNGPVTVQAGELQINIDAATNTLGGGSNGLGSAVTVNSGALLTLYGVETSRTLSIGSLAGAGTVRSESVGTQTLSVGGDDTSTTFSGGIQNSFSNVAGTIALTKVGAGALTLSGSNSYSGNTTVSAGRLVVDGSILASGSVSVASGAELGGSGQVAAITGAGLVAPGNSPGILTAPSASLASGLDFAFEFTQGGAPTWSSAASSGNDVLRLTDATTPLVGTATSGNVFDIYFLAAGETYIGGIFTDRSADFGSLLDAATFNYFARDAGGAISYGGFNYASLAAADVTRSIVQVA